MDWRLKIKIGEQTGIYVVEGDTPYAAKIAGLEMFLKEFNSPVKPYVYLTTKRRFADIKITALAPDNRKPTPMDTRESLAKKISRVQDYLKVSPLEAPIIDRTTRLLQRAKETVLVGK